MIKAVTQDDFAAALLVPTLSLPAGLRVGGRQASVERRFNVHRNNFVVTLIDALAASFPVTQALTGPEFFRFMARERVLAEPPRTPVLTEYALGLPDFLTRFPPAASVPYLADVARIEALRIRAFHATDALPVPESAYQELFDAPERMARARLRMHPASYWFRSRYAAYSIWQAHQGLDQMGDATLAGIDVERPEDVLIARPAFDVLVTALPPGSIALLDALRNGQPLGMAYQNAQAESGHTALLLPLIQHGLITDIDTVPED